MGAGTGHTKKEAEQQAAAEAYRALSSGSAAGPAEPIDEAEMAAEAIDEAEMAADAIHETEAPNGRLLSRTPPSAAR